MSRGYIPTDDMIAAVFKWNGNVSLAAKELGCKWHVINRRAQESAPLRTAIADAQQDAKEGLIDLAIGKAKEAVEKGQPWAISLVLKSQMAKERGFSELTKVDVGSSKLDELLAAEFAARLGPLAPAPVIVEVVQVPAALPSPETSPSPATPETNHESP